MRVSLVGRTFLHMKRALGCDTKLMTHSSTFDESTLVDKHKKRTFSMIREEFFVPACDHALRFV